MQRQADRQADIKTDRQPDRQTDGKTVRRTGSQIKQTYRQTDKNRLAERQKKISVRTHIIWRQINNSQLDRCSKFGE